MMSNLRKKCDKSIDKDLRLL